MQFLTMPKMSARNAGLAACSALAAVLFAGGMTSPQPADAAPSRAQVAKGAQDAVARAEARVAKSPRSGANRVDLAQAYFAQGRFASAATTLEDAEQLGDFNPRLALGLALAYIGSGNAGEALNVLAKWRTQIPSSDYGLAVALAGQPDQGVAILSDAVRSGEANAKTRQNLAYAYALSGRWAEARLIAAQDVSGDQLDERLAEWAASARPGHHQARIASLLGTPLGLDPGQPAALALNGTGPLAEPAPQGAASAVETGESAPLVAEVTPSGELAPIQSGETFWGAQQAAADEQPAAADLSSGTAPVSDWKLAAAVPQPAPERAPAFVRQPQAKPVPVAARTVADSFGTIRPVGPRHLVQLGSFKTRAGAERAWRIFQTRDPRLKNHTLRITEADVAGQRYYRVAAEGFDRTSAASLCGKVRQRGETCLAYAEGRKLPGTVPARPAGGRQLASR